MSVCHRRYVVNAKMKQTFLPPKNLLIQRKGSEVKGVCKGMLQGVGAKGIAYAVLAGELVWQAAFSGVPCSRYRQEACAKSECPK